MGTDIYVPAIWGQQYPLANKGYARHEYYNTTVSSWLCTTRIYAYETLCPNRCEPSIEVIMKMGVQWGDWGRGFGGVRVDVNVNEGLKLL